MSSSRSLSTHGVVGFRSRAFQTCFATENELRRRRAAFAFARAFAGVLEPTLFSLGQYAHWVTARSLRLVSTWRQRLKGRSP